ncbi:hypothetical protein ACLOJK_009796 [Asimina triloba]
MTCEKDDILPLDVKATWAAMEEMHKMGLARSIGVSNFTCKKLTDLLAHANIPPAVNQVEMHPVWQQKKLRDFCAEKGIHVSAYSPLGAKEWGFDVVLGNVDRNKCWGDSVWTHRGGGFNRLGEVIGKCTLPASERPDIRTILDELSSILRLEYVDLYSIHFPVRLKEGILDMTCEKDDILPLDVKATWAAMEEMHKMGLARSIGVSNFTCKKLTDLLAHANIPPAVNQVEMHPVWQQKKLRDFCAEKGIHVSAYSPLGAKEWGFDVVLGNALINDIARAKGKGAGQIALKRGLQQGVSLIPKSFNKGRLSQNFAILDWQLTEEELQRIGTIPQKRIATIPEFIFPDGMFKSPEEFWDGEM